MGLEADETEHVGLPALHVHLHGSIAAEARFEGGVHRRFRLRGGGAFIRDMTHHFGGLGQFEEEDGGILPHLANHQSDHHPHWLALLFVEVPTHVHIGHRCRHSQLKGLDARVEASQKLVKARYEHHTLQRHQRVRVVLHPPRELIEVECFLKHAVLLVHVCQRRHIVHFLAGRLEWKETDLVKKTANARQHQRQLVTHNFILVA
jgi:hypothetical protein